MITSVFKFLFQINSLGGRLPFGLSKCVQSIVFSAESMFCLLVRDACGCWGLPVHLSEIVVC
jgi:hypothetical protein